MNRFIFTAVMSLAFLTSRAQPPRFRALAFYSETVEQDHVDFAHQAIKFYSDIAQRNGFEFVATKDWGALNAQKLTGYQVVLWLNDQPHTHEQRDAFEQYMTHGGGWLGFHVAAYNDRDTKWAWFVDFLGGGIFYGNNWPPLPATISVDDINHAATRHLPKTFLSPPNEWYLWKPSPCLDKDVRVLLTLSRSNFPLGLKDTIEGGDVPVVWTNTRFRMIYMNMGHGDRIFTSDIQNRLFEDALMWLGSPPHRRGAGLVSQ